MISCLKTVSCIMFQLAHAFWITENIKHLWMSSNVAKKKWKILNPRSQFNFPADSLMITHSRTTFDCIHITLGKWNQTYTYLKWLWEEVFSHVRISNLLSQKSSSGTSLTDKWNGAVRQNAICSLITVWCIVLSL